MPPHCDSMDGPVVKAAERALNSGEVDEILAYAPKEAEQEIIDRFEEVIKVRAMGGYAQELAERYFYETVVRLHRAGEGETYKGLKPSGVDVGPVIPIAEQALESGSVTELKTFLCDTLGNELDERMKSIQHHKSCSALGVEHKREYVSEMLGLQVFSNRLYRMMKGESGHMAQGHHHQKMMAGVR